MAKDDLEEKLKKIFLEHQREWERTDDPEGDLYAGLREELEEQLLELGLEIIDVNTIEEEYYRAPPPIPSRLLRETVFRRELWIYEVAERARKRLFEVRVLVDEKEFYNFRREFEIKEVRIKERPLISEETTPFAYSVFHYLPSRMKYDEEIENVIDRIAEAELSGGVERLKSVLKEVKSELKSKSDKNEKFRKLLDEIELEEFCHNLDLDVASNT